MSVQSHDGRADATRRQILRAASHQFARRPYHDVGLDDILAEAELTKGAMYFHFKSKHALAVAIIEKQTATGATAVQNLMKRGLSGLETLIDFSYLVAVGDIKTDAVRAGLNLIESVGRTQGLQEKLMATGSTPWPASSSKPLPKATSMTGAIRMTWDGCWCPCTWDCGKRARWINRNGSCSTSRSAGPSF